MQNQPAQISNPTTPGIITNAHGDHIKFHADMECDDKRSPSLPQVKYSVDDLLTICESHPHPAVRRIAANMIYTMGKRDQLELAVLA